MNIYNPKYSPKHNFTNWQTNNTCLYCKKNFDSDSKYNFLIHQKSCEYEFNQVVEMYKNYNVVELMRDCNIYIKHCISCDGITKQIVIRKHTKEQIELYNYLKKEILNKAFQTIINIQINTLKLILKYDYQNSLKPNYEISLYFLNLFKEYEENNNIITYICAKIYALNKTCLY